MKSLRLNIKLPRDFKFYAGIQKTEKVLGINSKLKNGKHIIMWDFDKICIEKVNYILSEIQIIYNLSDIFILTDENRYGYRAICFSQVDFRELLTILIDTEGEDLEHIIWTARKRQATMRISQKMGRQNLHVIGCLYNETVPYYIPKELNFVKYETPTGEILNL